MDTVARAREIMSRMTLDEKLNLVSGIDGMYTKPLMRLGVRSLRMADATMGLRDGKVPATAFPAAIALTATWNRDLAARYGQAVAEEFSAAGIDVILGPGMNIYRVPQCGRNFEYFGEDPCLAAEIVVAYIRAAQEIGVAATAKHFACNNSDWHRCSSNSVVDERTLMELYLPAFEAAITRAECKSVMTAYNRVNGAYAGESQWLLGDVLLGRWGFTGLIMSDWEGLWGAEAAARSPIHLDMPGGKALSFNNLKYLLDNGTIQLADVEAKVLRILQWVLSISADRESKLGLGRGRCKAHAQVALNTAREAVVLLRNADSVLPLPDSDCTIAVIGPHANGTPTAGGGAARVQAVDPIDIVDGIRAIAPGVQLASAETDDALQRADAVIVCVGLNADIEGEAHDRPFELPEEQVALIVRAAALNERTIVVLTCGGGIDMAPWHDDVAAILHQWYPGENGCLALAEILFGAVNPSGKLPITIEKRFADSAVAHTYLPDGETLHAEHDWTSITHPPFDVVYAEGVFTGYRHFDATDTEPRYAFGHGLSYTTFTYEDLEVKPTGDGAIVAFTVRNTGDRSGAEVAQIYVTPADAPVKRPQKELKGFEKVMLEPGQAQRVEIGLDARAFAYYDVDTHDWCVAPGTYGILVAASAADVRLQATCTK